MSTRGSISKPAEPGATSLLRNGLYNVGGQAVRGVVGLLTIPFLIRLLGIQGYGVWSLAYAVLALVTMSEAGISVAAAVFLSKDLAQNDTVEGSKTLTFILICAVALSVALGLLLWLVGPLSAQLLTAFGRADRTAAGRALQVAGFAVSAFILQRVLVGIEQAFDRYGAINALDLAQAVVANVGLVAVAWLGGRAVAMMRWQSLTYCVLLIAHLCFVFHLTHGKGLRFHWSMRKARQIFRYSVAAWVTALGSAAFTQCDRLIVGAVLGAPLLGIYSAVTSITSRINSFSGTAVQPLVPALSCDSAVRASAGRQVRQAVHLNALVATEAGIFLYIMADWVMKVMVPGATSPKDILGLQIAVAIYTLYSFNAPGYFVLFSVGEASTNAFVTLVSSFASLALILAGARYFGLLGALGGNVGFLGTLVMVSLGLKRVRVAFRQYLTWIAPPVLGFVAALIVGLVLEAHFWWRVGFVAAEATVYLIWFLHAHAETGGLRFELRRVQEG